VQLTNREVQKLYNALSVLGNRKMATVGADLKVARLLRALAPLAEPLADTKKKAVQRAVGGVSDDISGVALQQLNMRLAAEQLEIDLATVEVELPLQFALKEVDLPKRKKDEDVENVDATGLGALAADLGILFTLDG